MEFLFINIVFSGRFPGLIPAGMFLALFTKKIGLMQSFSELIQSDQPVLVDFFAEWCGPCKMMPPILKEVKDKLQDKVKIIKVDVDKNPDAARTYQVQGVPTLILFRNGQIKWRQSGVVPAKQIQEIISQLAN